MESIEERDWRNDLTVILWNYISLSSMCLLSKDNNVAGNGKHIRCR